MAHALLEANMSDEFPERDRCEAVLGASRRRVNAMLSQLDLVADPAGRGRRALG